MGEDKPVQREGSGEGAGAPDLNDFRPDGRAPAGEAGGKGGFGGGGSPPPDLNDFRPGGRAPAGEAADTSLNKPVSAGRLPTPV